MASSFDCTLSSDNFCATCEYSRACDGTPAGGATIVTQVVPQRVGLPPSPLLDCCERPKGPRYFQPNLFRFRASIACWPRTNRPRTKEALCDRLVSAFFFRRYFKFVKCVFFKYYGPGVHSGQTVLFSHSFKEAQLPSSHTFSSQ